MVRARMGALGYGDVELRVPKANPSVRERVNVVNYFLKSASGEVRLQISRCCKALMRDLQEVSYKQDTGQIDKDRDRMRTHLSDALGYVLLELSKRTVGDQSRPL